MGLSKILTFLSLTGTLIVIIILVLIETLYAKNYRGSFGGYIALLAFYQPIAFLNLMLSLILAVDLFKPFIKLAYKYTIQFIGHL